MVMVNNDDNATDSKGNKEDLEGTTEEIIDDKPKTDHDSKILEIFAQSRQQHDFSYYVIHVILFCSFQPKDWPEGTHSSRRRGSARTLFFAEKAWHVETLTSLLLNCQEFALQLLGDAQRLSYKAMRVS